MTEIRPGMSVHLVKMPERGEHLTLYGIKPGDIGKAVRCADGNPQDVLWEVKFADPAPPLWLSRDVIEPTSPAGVEIGSPADNEPKFFWVKQYDVWWPACLEADGTYSVASNPSGYSEPASAFDEIGPRIEVPEGLK